MGVKTQVLLLLIIPILEDYEKNFALALVSILLFGCDNGDPAVDDSGPKKLKVRQMSI